ncbi:MAG: PsbP-related protein [bacterium]|nr:PsbP-related protein [bacterium]
MSDTNYSRTFFIIVAIGALAIIGTYFIFFQGVATISPTPEPSPTPENDNGWRTHGNEYVGFEVKYPADWKIVTEKNSFLVWDRAVYEEMIKRENSEGTVPDFSVIVYDTFTDFLRQNQYLQGNGKDIFEFYHNTGMDIKNLGETTLDGKKAVIAERVFFQDQVIVVAEKDGRVYEIAMRGLLNSLSDTQREVLKSFKFIESKSTINWKDYQGVKHGFELKYPAHLTAREYAQSESANSKPRWYTEAIVFDGNQSGDLFFGVNVYKNPNGLSLEEWIKENMGQTVAKDYGIISTNGRVGNKFRVSEMSESMHVAFVGSGVIIDLYTILDSSARYSSVFDQVVSTLRFNN